MIKFFCARYLLETTFGFGVKLILCGGIKDGFGIVAGEIDDMLIVLPSSFNRTVPFNWRLKKG